MKRSPLPEPCPQPAPASRPAAGRRRAARALALAGLLAAALPAAAQFKWIGPDGQINYSDRPPPADARPASSRVAAPTTIGASPATPAAGTAEAEAANAALPFAARTAAGRHPVVLYAAPDCPPCATARAHLARRGVPYAERTITTAADADAMKRLGFPDNGLPALSVGASRTQGYEPGAWDRLFDAAGYPKSTPLPQNWKASVEPLSPQAQRTEVKVVEAPGTEASRPAGADAGVTQATLEAAQRAARAAAPTPPPNPAGIRF